MEKYWDDNLEIISKYGMGAVYKLDIYKRPLHKRTDRFMEETYDYYNNYHQKLGEMSASNNDEDVLLLDIHSFSKSQANVFEEGPYPDVCIGFNSNEKDEEIVVAIEKWFDDNSISYRENFPYKGAMCPERKYMNTKQKQDKVVCLMLEINKKLYL